MKLIIGGAFQGKTEYARQRYGIQRWADGRDCLKDEIYQEEGIHHFHEYIKRMLKEGQDISEMAEKLREKNPEAVIVTNELGYGVVPIEAFDRKYRETTGRVCTKLAEYSSEVVRVVCGIGQVIKG
ncbi:MAG: bifunctional adenosylcobinamide kinase/adenosylcobinamide-phosphate guanylyltransferase [Ruminococcus sp.]|jgi:adenosylcobinamide kinase/adenosylcobinamide-phosphate guanylyltransferase